MADRNPSKRAARVWQRMIEWYGARFTDQYGTLPTEDWCEVVDDASNDTVKLVLSEVRAKHTAHPPTFPEFEQIFARVRTPTASAGPTNSQRLAAYLIANYPLTAEQLRKPWQYIGQLFDAPDVSGKMVSNHGANITGVIVPADGDAPGYRVMLADLVLEQPRPRTPDRCKETAIQELSRTALPAASPWT